MYRYTPVNTLKNTNRFIQYHERKDWGNLPTKLKYDNFSLFMSSRNQGAVISRINRLREGNKTRAKYNIPEIMFKWAKQKNINVNYAPAYMMDIENAIQLMNEDFIRQSPFLYAGDDRNVFHGGATLMDYSSGNPKAVYKDFVDFNMQDIQNMDVWQPVHIGISDSIQRYNNKIPSWQRTMNIRNMDLSPDVFNVNLADRDAIEQPNRGYNMNRIMEANYYNMNKQK